MAKDNVDIFYQRCLAGDIEGVKNAIQQYDIDPFVASGQALIYTIRGHGDEQSKKAILSYFKDLGVDFNVGPKVALEWAIITDDLELLQFLLELGAVLESKDDTLLFRAAEKNNTPILSFLLEAGIVPDSELLDDMEEFLELTGDTKDILHKYLT